jgi:hypothetical protein
MRVFISYSPDDIAFVRKLAGNLRAIGFDVWLAEEQVWLGDNAPLVIGKALKRTDAMVFVLSKKSVRSPNLPFEVGYAIGTERLEGKVVTILIEPVKNFPWILERLPIVRSKSAAVAARRVAEALDRQVAVA